MLQPTKKIESFRILNVLGVSPFFWLAKCLKPNLKIQWTPFGAHLSELFKYHTVRLQKQITISKTVINKNIKKLIAFWMFWGSFFLVNQNKNTWNIPWRTSLSRRTKSTFNLPTFLLNQIKFSCFLHRNLLIRGRKP